MNRNDRLHRIAIYTDGGSHGPATKSNPSPLAAGIILKSNEERLEIALDLCIAGDAHRAELLAIKYALLFLADRSLSCVTINTDSKYCCVNLLPTEEKASDNRLLIREVKQLIDECRSFRMKYVKAHSGHPENERADLLAAVACGKVKCPENVQLLTAEVIGLEIPIRFPTESLSMPTSLP